ncbi:MULTISPECIES: DUF402 domain-containing protein [Streptacidiphilus]|uniref:DUF402 domain-containing protein n=1 Tax=Streptacidiphilus cavernicola TaxID=3342716 RepID=A0ABV6UWG6_9ACTN|nr:DUF402 domain-containing protein [Streptacidiphilus jeojiense]
MAKLSGTPFHQGQAVARRDVFGGRVWTAAPYRVLADTGEAMVLAHWVGLESLAPSPWLEWSQSGDASARARAVEALAAGQWELGTWTWRQTSLVTETRAGDFFSVGRFYDAGHRLDRLYVNFQRPLRRTEIGIDTFDLLVDLVVSPDLAKLKWKDEDEYAHGRRLGVVTEREHQRVEAAREYVVGLIEDRSGPFAGAPQTWQPNPGWPRPALPAGALTVPVRERS